jgi:hypothetical protein
MILWKNVSVQRGKDTDRILETLLADKVRLRWVYVKCESQMYEDSRIWETDSKG